MNRRTLLLTAACALPAVLAPAVLVTVTFATAASAATQNAYTAEAFAAAAAAGKPILLFVEASWCPTCAKQRPIVASLKAQPEFKDLVILTVDFDSQKDVLKTFGVRQQSTLIALHGKTEKDRATGIVSEAAIAALMRKTVA